VLLLTFLLVLGIQDLVHLLDLLFEMVFILLKLGLEGDAVIHVLLSQSFVLLVFVVLGHAFLFDSPSLTLESVAFLSDVSKLLSHAVNLFT
jgi:hypothetical protein